MFNIRVVMMWFCVRFLRSFIVYERGLIAIHINEENEFLKTENSVGLINRPVLLDSIIELTQTHDLQ